MKIRTTSSTEGVNISWDVPYNMATNFEVYRNTINSTNGAKKIGTPANGELSYFDKTGEVGKVYYYFVDDSFLNLIALSGRQILSGSRLVTLSTPQANFDSQAQGQAFQTTLTTNAPASLLKATTTYYWLSAMLNGTSLKITAAQNLELNGRKGFVTVSAGDQTVTIYVNQAAAPTLKVTKVLDRNALQYTVETNQSSWSVSNLTFGITVKKLNAGFLVDFLGTTANGIVRVTAGNKKEDITIKR